jgi:single-stranded DNA-binding protein
MTVAKLTIIGQIKAIKYRTAGETPVCEVSVCKKRYAKQGEEPSYDWYRVNIWGKLPDFMAKKIAKDNFIGAVGDFSTRDWVDKDGNKKNEKEVKCQSFDVEVDGPNLAEGEQQEKAVPAPGPRRPAAPSGGGGDEDSSPPFMRRSEWE